MAKRLLFVWVFIVLLISIVRADGRPQGLRIISVEPVKSGIYAVVSVEFPKTWMDPKFTVEINGKPVRTKQRSGGFSGDRSMADFIFVPGRTQRQSVTVKCIAGGKQLEAKGSLDWTPMPFITILGYTGSREIITRREKLSIVLVNVTGVKIFFNGKEIHARPSTGDIQTVSFDPAWKKGKNVLTVNGDKWDGGMLARNFTFFDLGDGGTLPPGQSALLHYGQEGSKSGPFYDVKVEGDSIAVLQDARVRRDVIDKDGWVVSETWLARELKARKEGTSMVRIYVKHHFLQNMELEKEFAITVAQP